MPKDWVFDVESNNWVESETPVKTIEKETEKVFDKLVTHNKVKRNKHKTRPNSLCLVCDSPELKAPNTERMFKYCSKPCANQANRGIKVLSKNTDLGKKKRHGRNSRELCLTYYTLRKWDEPLTSTQIIHNARDLFGESKMGSRATNFNNMFYYFENVRKIKINGKNHFEIIDKSIPFNKSLKPRFNKVVFGE